MFWWYRYATGDGVTSDDPNGTPDDGGTYGGVGSPILQCSSIISGVPVTATLKNKL